MVTRRRRFSIPVSDRCRAALERVSAASGASVAAYVEKLLDDLVPTMEATAKALEAASKARPLVALEDLEAELTRVLGEGAVTRREIAKVKRRSQK